MTVVVIGTGTVAPGIAAAFVRAGESVRLLGRDSARAQAAAARASALAGGETVAADTLQPSALGSAELVIESVIENADVKRELLTRLEPEIDRDAVIATNTASLSITELAGALRRPGRFAGLHFLHPAHETAVVEVVGGAQTTPETIDRLSAHAHAIGKRPIAVRGEVPGFIWNRLQFALLRECVELIERGVTDVESIDAAVSLGLAPRWMATGPLMSVDLGGGDNFSRVAEQITPSLSYAADTARWLAGHAGGGRSLYDWDDARRALADDLRREAFGEAERLRQRREDGGLERGA